MPMSVGFENRLYPKLEAVAGHFGTPFHIYDEVGIRDTGTRLKEAFRPAKGFKEYYAVKALPNPRILALMQEMGFGFDCSSITELILARQTGAGPDDIMFTSNNTSDEEFAAAAEGRGSILNLDDISLVEKVPQMPELIFFRYNPGDRRSGNEIIGKPLESKYGVAHDQIIGAFRLAQARGARRFGLHTMLASNELNHNYMIETTAMLLGRVAAISAALNIQFEAINIGGGIGVNYRPEEAPFNVKAMADGILRTMSAFSQAHGYTPRLYMESGRYMTGPHGALVTRAINHKNIYRRYIGVDANMSSLMRPGMYGAYHHISVPFAKNGATEVVDVVGALCENNDKFAIQRELPKISAGDLVVIHDTGAHGHSMGFHYNGRLRPQELLLTSDGHVERIRRAETEKDHFATLTFEPKVLSFKS